MTKKNDLVLELLLNAIQKEIEAYNYYLKASESSPYAETKSLLLQLADEERKHRQALLREYRILREMFQKSKPRRTYLTKDKVSYQIPAKLPFKRLSSIPAIEVAGITLPTEFMGGDYLDTYPFSYNDNKLNSVGIVLCDIMGHGLKASQLKGKIKATFSQLIDSLQQGDEKEKIFETASLIHTFNQLLWKKCRKADSFITLFYCVLNPNQERLIYTSAGHNPPLLFTNDGSEYLSLANTQLIIGILEDVEYSHTEVKLKKMDILLLYSDGIIEATNKKGEEFGIERLVEQIGISNELSSQQIVQQVCQSLSDFLHDKPLHDDLSLAIAKVL